MCMDQLPKAPKENFAVHNIRKHPSNQANVLQNPDRVDLQDRPSENQPSLQFAYRFGIVLDSRHHIKGTPTSRGSESIIWSLIYMKDDGCQNPAKIASQWFSMGFPEETRKLVTEVAEPFFGVKDEAAVQIPSGQGIGKTYSISERQGECSFCPLALQRVSIVETLLSLPVTIWEVREFNRLYLMASVWKSRANANALLPNRAPIVTATGTHIYCETRQKVNSRLFDRDMERDPLKVYHHGLNILRVDFMTDRTTLGREKVLYELGAKLCQPEDGGEYNIATLLA
ncbi:hypothetical protein IW261DRAFT_1424741 [Armillaria novae-zelandiae]|uniref:Uncharacterized protein n=1 Tax=Armillaria novae-zelandiae TaxID=153914 RepID=A0AA39NU73_9AGAR|nr:hypothetical protein IW261DRAFT_1424741 [Armillaria novae-zelandiae]